MLPISSVLVAAEAILNLLNTPYDIADPWYSGNFDLTYEDIKKGCEALLNFIM